MTDADIIAKTAEFIKAKFSNGEGAHDWYHMERVWKLAKHLAETEDKPNMLVVELAALLHDIADWKFSGDEQAGPKAARDWLESLEVDEPTIQAVCYIVEHISFKGGTNKHKMSTLEGQIVQDADKLDALGAIGIARLFAYGGNMNRPIYDPENPPKQYKTFEEYKKVTANSTSLNHFYEKLLLLKDRMNTKSGRAIAEHRHQVIEDFLEEFYAEWDGKR